MSRLDRLAPSPIPASGFNDAHSGQSSRGPKTVVFILSTSYSGSHFLSLMLGSHSRAMHLGEIHRIRRGPIPLKDLCYACRANDACPVFSDIGPGNVERIHDIIFSRIDAGTNVLVDNSKLAKGWAEQFLDSGYQRKYIHLIRDPRALVRRWMLKQSSWVTAVRRRWRIARAYPLRSLTAPFASTPVALTYQWLELNRRITNLIARHGLDAQVLTYRDLARDPAAELRRLTEWVGLEHEPGQHEYWNFSHHGTQKAEYEWVKQRRSQHMDLRWRTELDATLQERIAGNGDVQAYLNELKLQLGPDGLTRSYAVSAYRV